MVVPRSIIPSNEDTQVLISYCTYKQIGRKLCNSVHAYSTSGLTFTKDASDTVFRPRGKPQTCLRLVLTSINSASHRLLSGQHPRLKLPSASLSRPDGRCRARRSDCGRSGPWRTAPLLPSSVKLPSLRSPLFFAPPVYHPSGLYCVAGPPEPPLSR